jgi:hypothetical protein
MQMAKKKLKMVQLHFADVVVQAINLFAMGRTEKMDLIKTESRIITQFHKEIELVHHSFFFL